MVYEVATSGVTALMNGSPRKSSRVVSAMIASTSARSVDAGAGVGRVAAALAARGHDVTAVEKDPDLVARSRRPPR